METQNNNAERSDSPTVLAAKQVIDTIFDQYENPRLTSAKIIDADSEDFSALIESLMSDPAKPILFITNQRVPKTIESKPDLIRILKFPNVRIVRTTNFVAEAVDIFDRGRYEADSAIKNTSMESLRSRIRHDLSHALNGSNVYDKDELIKKARMELGLDGDDEKIVKQIMNTEIAVEPETFTEINGVFVDWAGTLLDENYKFNEELFGKAQKKAKDMGMPIIIWTGGEVTAVYDYLGMQFKDAPLDIHVCNKADCGGLKIKHAIDDLPKNELEQRYKFKIDELEKV